MARTPPADKPMGRPTTYTEDVAERICAGISHGLTMKKVLRRRGMPARSTVFKWLEAHEKFQGAYVRARQHQAEHWADEVVDMASDAKAAVLAVSDPKLGTAVVQAQKLAVDARRWIVSKLLPRQFGESQHIEVSGEVVQKRIILVKQDGARTELPVGEDRENCRALPSSNGAGDSVNAKASSTRR